MATSCFVGPNQTFDAVAYVRNRTEDLVTPYAVTPAAYDFYIDAAMKEFARFEPAEDLVGNFGASPPTSPLVTVPYVNRYVLNAGNGFNGNVIGVKDVMFRASGVFTAQSEIAYLALMPVSPLNWFRTGGDILSSPSTRIIKDEWLQELDHYGIGYWNNVRDRATGLPAIDIWPVPTLGGIPIYVKYLTTWAISNLGSTTPTIPTLPEDLTDVFGKLLLYQVVMEEADRIIKTASLKAGITQIWSEPHEMREWVTSLRDEAILTLNGATGVALVSH